LANSCTLNVASTSTSAGICGLTNATDLAGSDTEINGCVDDVLWTSEKDAAGSSIGAMLSVGAGFRGSSVDCLSLELSVVPSALVGETAKLRDAIKDSLKFDLVVEILRLDPTRPGETYWLIGCGGLPPVRRAAL